MNPIPVVKTVRFPIPVLAVVLLLAAGGPGAGRALGGWTPSLRNPQMVDEALAPVVETCAGEKPVLGPGAVVTLAGEQFREGCRVTVGDKEATIRERVSAEKLLVTLPELPAQQFHPLKVVNPDGLEGKLRGGVPYGRLLTAVRPREVLPEGGDVVTVTGAGFEENTVFLFDGEQGDVQELSVSQAVVRPPPGKAGRAAVTVRTGDAEFAGNPVFGYAPHPYLYFRREDVPKLREKFANPMLQPYRKRLMDKVDALMNQKAEGGLGTAHLAIAWMLTKDDAYKDKALEGIRAEWGTRHAAEFKMMGVAGMAVGYDVLYPVLSPNERVKFRDYLERMLTRYLEQATGSWFIGGGGGNFSNTVPVGNSGGMLTALAIMHSSDRATEAIDAATRNAKHYLDNCISPDGGCREGVQYWDFGTTFLLILAHPLENATGDDRGLLDHPHLKNNVNFIRTQLGGHGGLFAFNDTRKPYLDGYAVCASLGSRYNQPLMLWVADAAARGIGKTRARDAWPAFAFLWRSQQPAPETFPGVPTLAWLKDMHWGAMRSDSSFKPALVVGVKGSRGKLTHHKQRDLGSYVLHANGEAYLVDPGYYEGKATDHTLPLIDGNGPGVSGSSITDTWEDGPWRHMTLDSTDGYGSAAKRVRRLIVMHGEDTVVVLDDIIPAKAPATITAQYQTGWTPDIDEDKRGMKIEGQNGTLHLRCFGHPLALEAADRTFSHGWHWKKISEAGPGDWHTVSAPYTADPNRPLLTVLQPAAASEPPPTPPRCRYDDANITVELNNGPVIRFRQNEQGWNYVRNTKPE